MALGRNVTPKATAVPGHPRCVTDQPGPQPGLTTRHSSCPQAQADRVDPVRRDADGAGHLEGVSTPAFGIWGDGPDGPQHFRNQRVVLFSPWRRVWDPSLRLQALPLSAASFLLPRPLFFPLKRRPGATCASRPGPQGLRTFLLCPLPSAESGAPSARTSPEDTAPFLWVLLASPLSHKSLAPKSHRVREAFSVLGPCGRNAGRR